MIIAHTGELNNILKQLEEQRLGDLPKFGIHAAETPVLMQNIGLAEGLIYGYPADKTNTESGKKYAEMYKSKYGVDPDPSSSNVYDSFNILLAAINKCGYENNECVKDELANLKDYQGSNGNLSVDGRGVGTYKEIMLKTVRNSKFEKLD
jgi:branched-chain amino acid transport system substrate-binding protein